MSSIRTRDSCDSQVCDEIPRFNCDTFVRHLVTLNDIW